MTYTVIWGVESLRAIRRLRDEDEIGVRAVAMAIRTLETDARPVTSGRFGGTEYYRLRVGDYRVFYKVDEAAGVIRLLNVGRTPPKS